jgi:hypothetical protein
MKEKEWFKRTCEDWEGKLSSRFNDDILFVSGDPKWIVSVMKKTKDCDSSSHSTD